MWCQPHHRNHYFSATADAAEQPSAHRKHTHAAPCAGTHARQHAHVAQQQPYDFALALVLARALLACVCECVYRSLRIPGCVASIAAPSTAVRDAAWKMSGGGKRVAYARGTERALSRSTQSPPVTLKQHHGASCCVCCVSAHSAISILVCMCATLIYKRV